MRYCGRAGHQVAQKRAQLKEEGMPQEQLGNVLADFREQQIKATKDTKAANSKAKKQGSVGEDDPSGQTLKVSPAFRKEAV